MSTLPSKAQILQWIADHPTASSKRDIAKAFSIKGAARIELKRLLAELAEEGHLEKRKRSYLDPERLPPVSVLTILPPDKDGDLFAKPMEWGGTGPEPRILFIARAGEPALGAGDRILGRLTQVTGVPHQYEARLIRKIGHNPLRILGLFRATAEGGRIMPIEKGADREWLVPAANTFDAKDGELVEAEQSSPRGRMGLPLARIVSVLGDPGAPKSVSLIAIHQHGIPDHFPDEVIRAADAAKPTTLRGRENLRDLPLITIDPSDARDHDDAVYAHTDTDPGNPGGHVVWVAIADVAHYVRPGTALDDEARNRGNSTYFPDRVVPMLPDILSGDLCSLHEGVARPCIAVRMVLAPDGTKRSHSFHRGLMRSAASLHYQEVQQAIDGAPNDRTSPLLETVLRPLYAAYGALKTAREERQPLELDLPERRIELTDAGVVKSVNFAERLDAHRLIEEFMVLANVCAGETLIAKRVPLLFRVHEEPSPEKLDALRETAQASGFALAKGQVLMTRHLNHLLNSAAGTDFSELINLSTLRSMTQAYYGANNLGHFGLALRTYAHFTSPIRRYADLIVHRALIRAHDWGKDGLTDAEIAEIDRIGEHISDTERRSMTAERDTTDRYLAAYLSDRVGNEFPGRISGIARFGVFVKLDETGADGLVPIRALGNEYFHHDREAQTLMGSDTGRVIGIGQRVLVRLTEAVPVTGGLMLDLLQIEDTKMTPTSKARKPFQRGKGGPKPPRKHKISHKRKGA